MTTTTRADSTLNPKLAELTARLEPLNQAPALLAELRQMVEQLVAERDQLRQRVEQLQVERDQLQADRSHLLHAWADRQVTEEELDHAEKEPGGCSLAEIWERLGKA